MIAATGVLHHPAYPDIKGLSDFEGTMFHSARWDHDVSLAGKRVGVVGTGSTAIQIVAAVTPEVVLLVGLTSVLIGVAAGLVPAVWATRLPIASTIRNL